MNNENSSQQPYEKSCTPLHVNDMAINSIVLPADGEKVTASAQCISFFQFYFVTCNDNKMAFCESPFHNYI